jgi:hypothetical protein
VLGVRFRDAQCGFKAVRGDVARRLVPLVQDRSWFFDTELLVLAEREGLRIHEVPVDWIDDPDSRVDIPATALEDLRGVWRLRRTRTVLRATTGDGRAPHRAATPAGAPAPSLVALTGLAPARLTGSEGHGRVHK